MTPAEKPLQLCKEYWDLACSSNIFAFILFVLEDCKTGIYTWGAVTMVNMKLGVVVAQFVRLMNVGAHTNLVLNTISPNSELPLSERVIPCTLNTCVLLDIV